MVASTLVLLACAAVTSEAVDGVGSGTVVATPTVVVCALLAGRADAGAGAVSEGGDGGEARAGMGTVEASGGRCGLQTGASQVELWVKAFQ